MKHFSWPYARGDHRRGRFASLVLAVSLAIAAPSHAGPAEDADTSAAAVQQLIDAGRAVDGETTARAAVAAAEAALGEDAVATANLYRLLGDTLFEQRRYDEAEPVFRKALAVREEKLPAGDPDIANSVHDLAITLKSLQRFDEAEELYRRAMTIREAAFGASHMEVARTWFALARLEQARGDAEAAVQRLDSAIEVGLVAAGEADRTVIQWLGERAFILHDAGDLEAAEPAYRRVLVAAEAAFPDGDLHLASWRQGLANLSFSTRRPAEAEQLYRAALAAREAHLGPGHAAVAASLEGLGRALERQRRDDEAVAAYRRALPIREKLNGAESPATDALLMRIGVALMGGEHPVEAEKVFRRLLALREGKEGPDGAGVGEIARWIANAANAGDRTAEAEIFSKRSLSISLATRGPDDILTGFDFLMLGLLYSGQQRFGEADPLLLRALAVMEAAGNQLDNVVLARTALAYARFSQRRLDEAADLTRHSLEEITAARGADAPMAAELMVTLAHIRLDRDELDEAERLAIRAREIHRSNPAMQRSFVRAGSLLGRVRMAQGRFDEAAALFEASLQWLETRFGKDGSDIVSALDDVGEAAFMRDDLAAAASAFERAVAITERLAAIDARNAFASRTGTIEDQAISRGAIFDRLVKTYDRLALARPARRAEMAEKAFLVAQRVIDSRASAALSQLGARNAAGSGDLAALVRERQDLVEDWQRRDRRLTAQRAALSSEKAGDDLAALESRLAGVDRRIKAIDKRLSSAFPDYAALRRPAPVGFAAVRAALAADEVLLFYADTSPLGTIGFETYLWVVPKNGAATWLRLEAASGDLSAEVARLRGLMRVGPETRGARSLVLDGGADRIGEVIEAALSLHGAVLAPARLIGGKKLVVVPSRSLASLPFHLLVSAPAPEASRDRYRDAGWVVRDHAITVLPSVSALAALGAAAPPAPGREPYLGFANPLLTGPSGDDRRAFARDDCGPAPSPDVQVAAAVLPEPATLYRGNATDVDAVRRLIPLPETADEACAIASALAAPDDALRLGGHASEAEVKRLSGNGRLARAAIVHFATHGLVSGDFSGLAEPAIVLTPPAAPSLEDDGLLTASEVTALRLAADWVILSACNTASGEGGGEALSGLARAFFYAGARALLVSHWPVQSDAAVNLVTGAVYAMVADPAADRAEALRRAMLAEIEAGGARADPAAWAPFILVGAAR
ncbi:CHAT domain-containing protein [Nitratireductor mangrovi]|uniref:CHAT domain-containing protein n=1 Tax=Nitratireductor mangrovi TaxID=2599600 RepID=A0A5B8L3C5_9HYPH|nr:tetratricopeptide repeat protein [Nitratireductor mangrovi]QDZ02150.2 CHAT domain-containing protein [Nitratireductor mangrovi]